MSNLGQNRTECAKNAQDELRNIGTMIDTLTKANFGCGVLSLTQDVSVVRRCSERLGSNHLAQQLHYALCRMGKQLLIIDLSK